LTQGRKIVNALREKKGTPVCCVLKKHATGNDRLGWKFKKKGPLQDKKDHKGIGPEI
jgi:hypothetical protein